MSCISDSYITLKNCDELLKKQFRGDLENNNCNFTIATVIKKVFSILELSIFDVFGFMLTNLLNKTDKCH